MAADPADAAPTATLTVSEEHPPGDDHYTVEFTRDGTVVRCKGSKKVDPRGRGIGEAKISYSGDLHPIYLVVAGKPHPNPKSIRNPADLLAALKELPLTLTEKESTKAKTSDDRTTQYEITFGKPGEK